MDGRLWSINPSQIADPKVCATLGSTITALQWRPNANTPTLAASTTRGEVFLFHYEGGQLAGQ